MEMLEKIHYQAAITGIWQGTSLNKLYEQLGWESLSDRRWSRRLFQIYKICNNMTPTYLLIMFHVNVDCSMEMQNPTIAINYVALLPDT